MDLKDFWYDLPQELIAQKPAEKRSGSKLLVLDKKTGEIEHKKFYDILEYLKAGDCLVMNNTRVIPARLIGVKEGTGGAIEIFLLNRLSENMWEVMTRPGKRAKPGSRFSFANGLLNAEIMSVMESGNRTVKFEYEGTFEAVLDRVGIIPLPPYITEKLDDPERYQTVYSKTKGSAAAPTAGLHFTDELLEVLRAKGIILAYVTLHVGLGTFRPVKINEIEKHKMHSEYYEVDHETCAIINGARKAGGRIVGVGTTSCRVLETLADEEGQLHEGAGWTDIFIYPGYSFKSVDMIITNFHLPESTLIMLISAFAGRESVMKAYETAVKMQYRFFSFGDAMFII